MFARSRPNRENRVVFSATRATILLWLCCCALRVQNASSSTHHSKRTSRSGSHQRAVKTTEEASVSQQQRLLSAPTDPDDVSEAIGPRTQDVKEGKVLGDYGSPANILRKLMHTGVDALQIGMDTFQDVSTKVYQIARKTVAPRDTVAGTGRTTVATSAESKSSSAENGRRRRWRRRGSRHTSSSAVVDETPKGLVNSVTSIIDTGIVGMQEATDIGLLLGNMGTHKFRAILDGKNGNQEVYKLLIKFISSKVGKNTKGNNVGQFIDDIGTVANFIGDDSVSEIISQLMEKFMTDQEVAASLVRLAITMLDSSESTSCLLDRLPLSDSDVRMVFDVFVGSNGQAMLQTIASILSDLTSGPDTKAFLESIMGMMSMFKSDSSSSESDTPSKTTSLYGSLMGFFTGGDEEPDATENQVPAPLTKTAPLPQPTALTPAKDKGRKKAGGSSQSKPPNKKKFKNLEQDFGDWFDNDGPKTAVVKSRSMNDAEDCGSGSERAGRGEKRQKKTKKHNKKNVEEDEDEKEDVTPPSKKHQSKHRSNHQPKHQPKHQKEVEEEDKQEDS